MGHVYTPAVCRVNLGAIKRNFRKLGDPSRLAPVVKSDAYGHGLSRVAKALSEVGARHFAVGVAAEGEELRDGGFTQAIYLLLGCQTREDWEKAASLGLTPFVGSIAELRAAETTARDLGVENFAVALKCDTGMSRLGFSPSETAEALAEARSLKRVKPTLLASHLASAEDAEEENFTRSQFAAFEKFYEALRGVWPDLRRSLANSAAYQAFPEARHDLSRPGFSLYGGDPFDGARPETQNFEWAMSLGAPVLAVRDLAPGQSVSYGRLYKATRPTRVAAVACGYANGLPRRLSGRFEVTVNGGRARQIGAVCMSMSLIDVTDLPETKPGDWVWIMGGPKGTKTNDVVDLARLYDAIPYEILCLFGSINPREYADE